MKPTRTPGAPGAPSPSRLLAGLATCASLVLGTVTAAAVGLGSLPVLAQEPLFDALQVELVPMSDVVGDGRSRVALHLVAMGQDGAPEAGLTAKVLVSSGQISELTEVQPGIYRLDWSPPAVSSTRNIELSLRGKTVGKEKVQGRWSLPLVPPLGQQLSATASPARMVLGQDEAATLTVSLSGGAAQAMEDGHLVIESSAGTITNLTALGTGRFTALYTPPAELTPQLAIITLADARDPASTFGVLTLPLVGKAEVPVVGMPESKVILKVGEQEFGPIQADRRGKAQVPIIVPPGVREATLISILGEERTEEALALDLPATSRARLLPLARGLPADPAVPVEVRAYVARPEGGSDEGAKVTLSASAGTMSEARHEGGGVYVSTFTPPLGNARTDAVFQVSVEDPAGEQTHTRTVPLLPARPAGITLSAEPATLPAGTVSFEVSATLRGPDGAGMPDRVLELQATGAKVTSPMRSLGDGAYAATLQTTGSGPVDVVASLQAEASVNPLHEVIVLPSRQRLPPDGLSSAMLTVVALDIYGYPVADTTVSLRLITGDGSIPASADTDAHGVAQVYYTAGREPGIVHIQATAGEAMGAVGLLQLPADTGPASLPPSGNGERLALEESWSRITESMRIERE